MAFDGSDPCWVPAVPIAENAAQRLRIAQFGDGYEQRTLDGINSLERSWSLTFDMRAEADLADMDDYLASRAGAAFPFQHPATGVTYQVFADEWKIDWQLKRSGGAWFGTLSAEFRVANGSAIQGVAAT